MNMFYSYSKIQFNPLHELNMSCTFPAVNHTSSPRDLLLQLALCIELRRHLGHGQHLLDLARIAHRYEFVEPQSTATTRMLLTRFLHCLFCRLGEKARPREALSKEGNPEFATVLKVLRALDLKIVTKVA